jgi:hypothetical protein
VKKERALTSDFLERSLRDQHDRVALLQGGVAKLGAFHRNGRVALSDTLDARTQVIGQRGGPKALLHFGNDRQPLDAKPAAVRSGRGGRAQCERTEKRRENEAASRVSESTEHKASPPLPTASKHQEKPLSQRIRP